MARLFKFLFIVLGIVCISVVSFLGIIYIDDNDLMDVFMEKSNTKAFFPDHTNGARLSFAMPHDDRPIVVDISDGNTNDLEYQYIYPSQIFYASTAKINLLFRDSVFNVTNNIGIKSITERLKSSHGTAFIYTQSYVINRAAIIGVRRTGKQDYNYGYYVKLLNNEEIPISKEIYKQLTDKIDLAAPDYSF